MIEKPPGFSISLGCFRPFGGLIKEIAGAPYGPW